jgi:hypothetical protein
MKITLTPPKPRNPLVAAAHFRRAGTHRPRGGALRQNASRTLKRELDQIERTRQSP